MKTSTTTSKATFNQNAAHTHTHISMIDYGLIAIVVFAHTQTYGGNSNYADSCRALFCTQTFVDIRMLTYLRTCKLFNLNSTNYILI